MASVLLSSVVGGGGLFVPYSEPVTENIPIGSSGLLTSFTPSAGNVVTILSLSTGTVSTESNITLTIGTNDGDKNILNDGTLGANDGNGQFIISNLGTAQTNDLEKCLNNVTCQSFSITKTIGTLATSVRVSYVEGRIE